MALNLVWFLVLCSKKFVQWITIKNNIRHHWIFNCRNTHTQRQTFKTYRFRMMWGWINVRIFVFGWTITLNVGLFLTQSSRLEIQGTNQMNYFCVIVWCFLVFLSFTDLTMDGKNLFSSSSSHKHLITEYRFGTTWMTTYHL